VNDYIKQKIEDVQGFDNLRHRVINMRMTDGRTIKVVVASIGGLFLNFGQIARPGFCIHDKEEWPVIYVDDKYYYDEKVLSEEARKIPYQGRRTVMVPQASGGARVNTPKEFRRSARLTKEGISIPVMVCNDHRHMYHWVKRLQRQGVVDKDTTIINIDHHPDSTDLGDPLINLTCGNWMRLLWQQGFSTGKRVWVGATEENETPRYYAGPEDIACYGADNIFGCLDDMKEKVTGKAIVTIDYDAIAPIEEGDITIPAIERRVKKIIDSLFDSGITPVAINFTFSETRPYPKYLLPKTKNKITKAVLKLFGEAGYTFESGNTPKKNVSDGEDQARRLDEQVTKGHPKFGGASGGLGIPFFEYMIENTSFRPDHEAQLRADIKAGTFSEDDFGEAMAAMVQRTPDIETKTDRIAQNLGGRILAAYLAARIRDGYKPDGYLFLKDPSYRAELVEGVSHVVAEAKKRGIKTVFSNGVSAGPAALLFDLCWRRFYPDVPAPAIVNLLGAGQTLKGRYDSEEVVRTIQGTPGIEEILAQPILVIDDIIALGGTLLTTKNILKEKLGAKAVYTAAIFAWDTEVDDRSSDLNQRDECDFHGPELSEYVYASLSNWGGVRAWISGRKSSSGFMPYRIESVFEATKEQERKIFEEYLPHDFRMLVDTIPMPFASPAECLMSVKDDKKSLAALMRQEGLAVRAADEEIYKVLSAIGVCVTVNEYMRVYRFSDMMLGPDENYTRSMINAISDMREHPDRNEASPVLERPDISDTDIPSVREQIRMTVIHEINKKIEPAIPVGKILWHVIDKEMVGPNQLVYFQNLNSALEKAGSKERIRFVRERESLREAIDNIKAADAGAVIDVATDDAKKLTEINDKSIKALILERPAGDFRQIEGIVAALRALREDRSRILPALKQIYRAIGAVAKDGNEMDEAELLKLLDTNPLEFARRFIYVLPPIEKLPDDLPGLNKRLREFLISA